MSVADLKQRDSRELAMSAIVYGNRLLDAINQGFVFNALSAFEDFMNT